MYFALVVSVLAVGLISISGATGEFSLSFALFLLALAFSGYFLLSQLKKAGVDDPSRNYLFILATLVGYCAVLLSFSAPGALLSYFYLPLVFCSPAIANLVKGLIS